MNVFFYHNLVANDDYLVNGRNVEAFPIVRSQ